ncbi:hypothetical protein L6164_019495 [Bauhinia variegata]|uniref:Uncharacterized protein n=1 Tax=Bauhinia variegata TaxID=167791 RepID=A0ACB9MVH3_BAUVA|nr:hypothetical protein L6164_019495 [Bauhinia variegata]
MKWFLSVNGYSNSKVPPSHGQGQEHKLLSKQIVVKANERPEWLPDVWIVDVRTRKSGVHMGSEYKCYIEPSNGHRFYSKPEVLRYLETVKGNSCTSKKEKRCTNLNSTGKPASTAKRQKPKWSATIRQLFVGEEISYESSLELLDAHSSKGVLDMSVEIIAAPVRADETVVNLHSQGDAAVNPPDTNEKSNPADVQENLENGCVADGEENSNKKNQGNPSVSRNKKQFSAPHRFSKRLAGIEPSLEADTGGHERALQVPKRNTRKSITTNADLANKSSRQFNVVPQIENVHSASCINKAMQGEPLSKCHKPSEDEGVSREQQHQLKTEKIDDNNPEQLHYSLSQDSSLPGINVAMKSVITGEFPILDNPASGHSLTSEASALKENELHVSMIGKSGDRKIHARLNKSSNKKKQGMPCRASKRLAGVEPELKNDSIYSEKPPEYKSRKSKGEVNKVAHQNHDPAKISAPMNGESLEKSRKSPNVPDITDKPVERDGDKESYNEKSGHQLSFAFQYSWSDPCLEFAIKTLTGVLPIEHTVGNGANFVPGSDSSAKSNRERNSQVNSKKRKTKKELKLPRRLSKRLAGHEPELVPAERPLEYATRKSHKDEATANVLLNNGASKHLYASYEIQTVPEEKLQKPEAEKIGNQRSNVSLNKGTSEHLGTSKETDHSVHASYSSETTVYREPLNKSEKPHEAQIVPEERLQKPEAGKVGDQRSNVNMNDRASEHLDTIKEIDNIVRASDSSETRRAVREPLNKSEKSHEAQTIPEEQLQKPEAEKFADQRSEPHLSPFGNSWSDPCLEFAFKTLTGALPVEATADVFPIMSTSVSGPPDQDLLESVVENSVNEVHDNSKQSDNKREFNLFWEPSKQNLRQPEFCTKSASCENSSNFATAESYFDEGYYVTGNLDEGNPVNIEVGNMIQLNHHSRNINMFSHEEPAKNFGQVLQGNAVPAEQSQLETLNSENPDSHFCAPFMDSWSDPCLEFAFKTLTGAIPLPVEENLAIQGSFPGPANCHGRGDGGSTLPDFVSPSFSQSDISSHHDMGKSIPGLQPSMGFSFLPRENVSVHNGSGVDSWKSYPHYNKKF